MIPVFRLGIGVRNVSGPQPLLVSLLDTALPPEKYCHSSILSLHSWHLLTFMEVLDAAGSEDTENTQQDLWEAVEVFAADVRGVSRRVISRYYSISNSKLLLRQQRPQTTVKAAVIESRELFPSVAVRALSGSRSSNPQQHTN